MDKYIITHVSPTEFSVRACSIQGGFGYLYGRPMATCRTELAARQIVRALNEKGKK